MEDRLIELQLQIPSDEAQILVNYLSDNGYLLYLKQYKKLWKKNREEQIKTVNLMCNLIIKQATNTGNLAYLFGLEDEQWWLDYQDELNKLSIERKKQ